MVTSTIRCLGHRGLIKKTGEENRKGLAVNVYKATSELPKWKKRYLR
jgi:hypothetical protein